MRKIFGTHHAKLSIHQGIHYKVLTLLILQFFNTFYTSKLLITDDYVSSFIPK